MAGARVFPASAAAWDTAFASPAPVGIWTMQAAASPVPDDVGAEDLTQNQAVLYQQAGDPTGRFTVVLDTTNSAEFLSTPTLAFTDMPSATPWSMLVRFTAPDIVSLRSILNKGAVGQVWALRFIATGALRFEVLDGVTTYQVDTANVYDANGYHDVAFVYDQAGGLFLVHTELESVSLSAAGFLGVVATVAFHVGSGGGNNVLAGTGYSYLAFWDNYAFTAADLTEFRTPQ